MSRIRCLAAALAAGACLATPSLAADYGYGGGTYSPTPAYGAAPGFDWAGLYAGGVLGYGWGSAAGSDTSGFSGGLTAGANWVSGPLIFGGEADISYTGIGYNGLLDRYDLDWLGTARGRVGYAFDRFMAYGTGGFAWTSAEYAADIGGSDNASHFGWTVGFGAEAAITDRISAKAEFLHMNFGSERYSVGAGVSVDPTVNLIRFGLNYHF